MMVLFAFPFKHRNEGLFPSVYIRDLTTKAEYSTEFNKANFPRPILRQDTRCFRQERFFALSLSEILKLVHEDCTTKSIPKDINPCGKHILLF